MGSYNAHQAGGPANTETSQDRNVPNSRNNNRSRNPPMG